MKKIVLSLFLAAAITTPLYAESLTLTTYYPAPFGAYDRLRLVPREEAIEDPCQSGMFYVKQDGFTPNVTATLRFCMDDGQGDGEGTFEPIGVWTKTDKGGGDADVYLTDQGSDINVGIGTTTPEKMLDVAGDVNIQGNTTFNKGIQIGDSDSEVPGTLRWRNGDFEGYNGTSWVSFTNVGGGGGGGTEADCDGINGTWEAAQELCYVDGSTCPVGWNQSQNFSSTQNASCDANNPPDANCGYPENCSTGSHIKSNEVIETCSYRYCSGVNGWYFDACAAPVCSGFCTGGTCTATITQVGCLML